MLSAIVQGILMGSIYGLIALGLTLIFGIMKVINFAHGAFLMLAMYISYYVIVGLNLHPYVSLIIVVPVMFLFGYIVNKFLIQYVLKKEADTREPIGALLLTAALAIILENGGLGLFGTDYKTVITGFSSESIEVGSIIITLPKLYAFILCFIVTILFYIFLHKTEIGRKVRAVGQDRNAAKLMGINVEKTFNIAFGVGTALLGTAAVAIVPFYNLHPTIGTTFGTMAFVTVVLGGLGSIPGAIIAGLLIGIVESVSSLFVPYTLSPMIVFYGFLIFLFIKPSGLFGSPHDW
ncbi:ABC transporter permease [Ureibacillus massiliensis 4400831 = CIP 108448 = CCUG 49529]|uniref:ABC transporter permease n=1 Tax=Ureibacillus massiliensis 4400831 = CIP 108448 = CCUG 49529 TaxID=1211035 RepID=A0A0A3J162_9BACL|nr:branched-chain amino acid ABC transporter permease [Ureibacillus massiliensis]KGR90686.1 ABC transporter permease [Ureibacillus massiliensis 4400831 = CIP 108448 = CCUG 49529]